MTMLSDGMLLGVGGNAGPVFVAEASAEAANTVTLTVNKPAGTASGDLMIAVVWGNSFTALTLTGWTQVFISTSFSNDLAVFTKTAGGSEPSTYSFTGTQNVRTGTIVTYRGGVGAIDVQGTGVNSAPSTAISTALSITTTISGVLLATFNNAGPRTVSTPPSGMTQRSFVTGTSGVATALYELTPSPVGATGNKTLTWNSSNQTAGWLVQIY